jgi:hypothetical protein
MRDASRGAYMTAYARDRLHNNGCALSDPRSTPDAATAIAACVHYVIKREIYWSLLFKFCNITINNVNIDGRVRATHTRARARAHKYKFIRFKYLC